MFVELKLGIQACALLLQVGQTFEAKSHDIIHLAQGIGPFGVMGSHILVTGEQRPVAPPCFGDTGAVFSVLALALLLQIGLALGQRRADGAFDRAVGIQLALLAVGTFGNGAVMGEPAALVVNTGVNALGRRQPRCTTQHHTQHARGKTRPLPAAHIYPSVTPYRWR